MFVDLHMLPQILGRLDEAIANLRASLVLLTRHQVGPMQRMHTLKVIMAHQIQLGTPFANHSLRLLIMSEM